MLGRYPVATLPVATLDPADLDVVAGALSLLLADPDAYLVFLLETSPGDDAVPAGTMLRLSDRGFSTSAADTPASTGYAPRLTTPLNFESRIPLPDSLEAVGAIGFGVVEIRNEDKELDALLAKSWEGRQAEIKIGGTINKGRSGEYELTFDEYGLALMATVDGVVSENGEITLRLREGLGKLERKLQSDRYLGTGGMEGPAELEGVLKPLTFGEVENRSCILVDSALLIYQVHQRSIEAIDEVRLLGVNFGTYDGDVSPLSSWTPVAGHWVSDLAIGAFRIGSTPNGELTADVRGDNTGGYVSSTADVAKRIATWKGEVSDPGELEGATFLAFSPTSKIGFASDEEIGLADALASLLAASHGWIRVTREARLAIGRFIAPETASIVAFLTDTELSSEDDDTSLAPVWSVKVGYRRMWTAQNPDSLATGVSVDDRKLYSTEYRYVVAQDATVKTIHKDAREIEFNSLLIEQSAADTMAAELLALFALRRRLYRARQERSVLQRIPGDVLLVTSASQSDLNPGRQLLVISAAEIGAERAVDLELWG